MEENTTENSAETETASVPDVIDSVTVNMLARDGKVLCRNCTIRASRYRAGNGVAIEAICADGEQWGVLTVNLPESAIAPDCVAVKNYSEGEGNVLTLITAGIIEDKPVSHRSSGFVVIPVFRLTDKGMALVRAYDRRTCGFAVGDKVSWHDPDGEVTGGWTVTSAPDPGDDGKIPDDGMYTIQKDGSLADAYGYELDIDARKE